MKLLICSDPHGYTERLVAPFNKDEEKLTEGDVLFILGDSGLCFFTTDDPMYENERIRVQILEKKPYTVAFIDGNHEHFGRLLEYPTEIWMGAPVHRIAKNIVHLMRGQVYNVGGKSIFTFGGAATRDKYRRRQGVSWFTEELPCADDYKSERESLKQAFGRVDYIFTHTGPMRALTELCHRGELPDVTEAHLALAEDAELMGHFDWLMDELKFEKWFFGHWHLDCLACGGRVGCIYNRPVLIEI